MTEIEIKQLNDLLSKWFEEITIKCENNNKEIFYKENINWGANQIGRLIKDNLKKIKRWKGSPRGNPEKGYKIMKKNDF